MKQKRRTHNAAFKAKVDLAAIKGDRTGRRWLNAPILITGVRSVLQAYSWRIGGIKK